MSLNHASSECPVSREAQADWSLSLEDAIFCVVDTETTGFDPQVDAVVEVAGVHTTIKEGVLSHESWLVDPKRPIPADATEVHGLTDQDVAGAGTLPQALGHLHERAFSAWVAHNAAFDFRFVDPDGIPVLCTLRLARRLWPNLPAFGNQFLREHFKFEVEGADGLPAHRAEPDALVTAELLRLELQTVREQYPNLRSLGDLLAWLDEPFILPVCHLGKVHRGKPWSEVPRDYMAWALEHYSDLDLDHRATLEFHLGSKAI